MFLYAFNLFLIGAPLSQFKITNSLFVSFLQDKEIQELTAELGTFATYSSPSRFNQVFLSTKLPVSFLKLTCTSPDIFCISGYVLTAVDILERTGFIPPSLELTGFASCGRKILSAFCLLVIIIAGGCTGCLLNLRPSESF